MFYENGLIGTSYAEPYAGGAGLALKLLFEGYVNNIYINDFDKSIYIFWRIILDYPEEFCKWLDKVEISIKNWNKFKKIQSTPQAYSQFDLARSTFFLNRTNISGVISGGIIGGQDQKGKYKINARFNKIELIDRIQKIASLKSRISVTNLDGVSLINKLNKKKEEIFIYLDPPYLQKGADLYMNYYLQKDHQRLSRHVSKLTQKWMVSYDNHEFILNLYSSQRKIIYKLSQCASNRVGDEILIFSDAIKYRQSMNALSSPVVLGR
jgi:DNA adenine methylase